jgi:hypothetical protein
VSDVELDAQQVYARPLCIPVGRARADDQDAGTAGPDRPAAGPGLPVTSASVQPSAAVPCSPARHKRDTTEAQTKVDDIPLRSANNCNTSALDKLQPVQHGPLPLGPAIRIPLALLLLCSSEHVPRHATIFGVAFGFECKPALTRASERDDVPS